MPNISPVNCTAALAVAEPFLREEGFTDVRYPKMTISESPLALAEGKIDFMLGYAATHLLNLDSGSPVVVLGGVHVGCWQVLARPGIASMRDFKGRTIAVVSPTGPDGLFLAMTLGNVGVDIRSDVNVVSYQSSQSADLLTSGKVDGLMAFPPIAQDLKAHGIGTVVLNSMVDRPWSNYFCCMAAANRKWMERHPVATKRALRAVLRAADLVAAQPDQAARTMVDGGFTTNYEYTCEALREIPYDVWRRYDPADTLRFLALRMSEAGVLKTPPEKLIERGSDFRFLADLKRQLKEA